MAADIDKTERIDSKYHFGAEFRGAQATLRN